MVEVKRSDLKSFKIYVVRVNFTYFTAPYVAKFVGKVVTRL